MHLLHFELLFKVSVYAKFPNKFTTDNGHYVLMKLSKSCIIISTFHLEIDSLIYLSGFFDFCTQTAENTSYENNSHSETSPT